MPSLGTEWIRVVPDMGIGGHKFEFKTEISVNKAGLFQFTIPAELEKTARDNWEVGDAKGISLGKLTKNYCVWSQSRSEGIEFLRKVAHDYIQVETTRELVIVYRTVANLSYYKKADGTIVPNGAWDRDYPAGTWGGDGQEDFGFSTRPSFTVGLAAAVYTKITAHRESGDQVTWEPAGENCHSEPDTYLDKLNSFIRVRISPSNLNDMQQIPYTEEAAKFFFEAMLSMCKLSDRIESFFGDTDNVQKAIAAKGSLMLGDGYGE